MTTNIVNKITQQNYANGSIEAFAQTEADQLGLPFEIIRSAVYVQPKGNKPLYFGQGQVSILAVLAMRNLKGVIEFSEPRFKMLELDHLIASQSKIKDYIFGKSSINTEETGKLYDEKEKVTTELDRNGQEVKIKSTVDTNERISHFTRISVDNIYPTKSTQKLIDEYDGHFLYYKKDTPAIHSCVLDYLVVGGEFNGKKGTVEYVVDYSLTKLKTGVGAALHLIPTMITRAKKIAYERAFGSSPDFFMKACKLDLYSEYRSNNLDDALESETVIAPENAITVFQEQKKRKHASIINHQDWQGMPNVISI
jgi:hypothetical protein